MGDALGSLVTRSIVPHVALDSGVRSRILDTYSYLCLHGGRKEGTVPSSSVLAVSGLGKSFGTRRVLDHVDLDVAPGEIVGLLGPNGAGKTTLVSIISGLVHPDEGTVRVGPFDVGRAARDARRLLGIAPQETGVYPTLTCRQNLRFFAELSGGERRRLHTAIALTHRPALVLLDEPTTGADVHTRAALLELVTLVAAQGSAVVYSTHYLAEVEQLAASVVILDGGRVLTRGTVNDLVAAHGSSVIELNFRGAVPPIDPPPGTSIESHDSLVRLRARDPGPATAALLVQLGDRIGTLRSFEIVQPSLETVFLELTGRRIGPEGEERSDVA
jgi:ABC-2 type transport system ATP-binding protein